MAEKLTSGGSHWWDLQGNEKYMEKTFQLDALTRSCQSFCVIYGRSCEGVQSLALFSLPHPLQWNSGSRLSIALSPERKHGGRFSQPGRFLGKDDIGKKNNKCVGKTTRKQKSRDVRKWMEGREEKKKEGWRERGRGMKEGRREEGME